MSFKDKIDNIMESAVQSSLAVNEATLKVSNFTGKIADKAGFKMKKVGDSNPGADVIFTGDEKAIISYARQYLGTGGKTISDIQRDVAGGPGSQFGFGEATEEDSDAEIDGEMIGKICQCCDNKITADGCGCDETCKHCGGMGKAVENEQKEAKLDPVGKADADIDNDGDVDSTDDYLKNRRKKIGKAMDAKKLKEMAKASKTESIKGGLEKGADGYSSHDYHRIAIALAGGRAAYERMPYGIGQRYRDKSKEISNSEKDRILSRPTPN
tara:strand:- start:241 stop:1047 length:807 start_codon:yes stop_codon:yes gene_type:complete